MQRTVAFVLLICILYFVDNIPPGHSTPVKAPFKTGYCPDVELQPFDHPNPLPCGRFCNSDSDCGLNNPLKCCASGCGTLCRHPDCNPVMLSFGMLLNKMADPRSFRSWCIKGTDESLSREDSSVPLMYYDFDDPDTNAHQVSSRID